MKTFTFEPKLDTDYTRTGNSSDQQIDTLAIAMTRGDYNDIVEYNIDYIFSMEDQAMQYWLDNDCEAYFDSTLSKEDAKKYAEDLGAYNEALAEYKDTLKETHEELPEDHPYIKARYEANDETHKELRHDWLYGDYRGNFEGIIPQANKYYGDYGINFEYDDKKGVLSIEVENPRETANTLINEGYMDSINRPTEKSIITAIESMINYRATSQHEKKVKEREARRQQQEKTREYKKEQAERKKNDKKAHLLSLAK